MSIVCGIHGPSSIMNILNASTSFEYLITYIKRYFKGRQYNLSLQILRKVCSGNSNFREVSGSFMLRQIRVVNNDFILITMYEEQQKESSINMIK